MTHDDLVKRLRARRRSDISGKNGFGEQYVPDEDCQEAADAIEALKAKLRDMHRRAQAAEAALREPIEAAAPERRTLGRMLANAAFYAEYDRAEALQAQLAEARDKALEDAARKADPPQVRTTKGLWVLRREKIAAAIRAMKGERG